MGLAQSTPNYAKTLSKLLVPTTIQDGQGMRIHYTILTGIISNMYIALLSYLDKSPELKSLATSPTALGINSLLPQR
jgi:hypothetical protein